ncbi:3-hydroxyacyl-(acyl-carrier-protein) dehydratase FabZ [uncultured Desulfobacterium sp.]|uniref:3-hydroxyacyl-(Acyl-carrier-protein) dehydratase FabZ n=1 Tax=uncultured Desulfobacterium sp. TaxID=201089 RepID=A0A445MZP9_9BACT|nr:3-hydroxyacyl-(acyl-carrier-protein) dehydratase FabZ [uncultured Desulfobacterium sp.]
MSEKPLYDQIAIREILPQSDPFVFVDRAVEMNAGESIVAEKDLRGEEVFFAGHFPGRPLMPGVLVSEALAQTSGLLLGLSSSRDEKGGYFLASVNMKFLTPAKPGDTLRLESRLVKGFGGLYMFDVTASVGDTKVAKGTLSLAQEKK